MVVVFIGAHNAGKELLLGYPSVGDDVHGVEDRHPFDIEVIVMPGCQEKVLGEDEPQAARVFQQVYALFGDM